MRSFLLFFALAISFTVSAQKKYDCVVRALRHSDSSIRRMEGELLWIDDSSILIKLSKSYMTIHWSDLRSLRFRKHNGYGRTFLPISLSASAALATAFLLPAQNHNGCGCLTYGRPLLVVPAFASFFLLTTIIELPIYLFTRDHKYFIRGYKDFQLLQADAAKYILPQFTLNPKE